MLLSTIPQSEKKETGSKDTPGEKLDEQESKAKEVYNGDEMSDEEMAKVLGI